MAQSYQNIEILLVDDGSTDGSGRICEELAEEDPRIRVFHKKNGGSSSARNLGIGKASGEYLGFVDSDDYIDPEMYELLYQGIRSFQAKAAQVGRNEIDMSGKLLPNICEPPNHAMAIDSEGFLREMLLHRGDCSFCTKLLHRELFLKERFPEGVLNEDFRLLVKLLPQIGEVVSLPRQAYHVFYRIGSNTRKKEAESFSRVFEDGVVNADMVTCKVVKHYPGLQGEALRFGVFQRLEYLLHIPIGQMTKDNTTYRNIISWLRKHWWKGMGNPFLTKKNKVYLMLFVIAPKSIRIIHSKFFIS